MSRMFKWGAVAVLALALALLAGTTKLGRYARSEAVHLVKDAEEQVPPGVQIRSLNRDVKKLDGGIDAQKNKAAAALVALRHARADKLARLDKQAQEEAEVDNRKTDLAALHRQIAKAKAGCEPAALKDEFTATFAQLEAAKARAASAEEAARDAEDVVRAAEEGARAAEALLQEKIKERDALVRKVAELEALYGEVLTEEARTQSRGGDSEGAAIRADADKLYTQLEVRRERAAMNGAKPGAKPTVVAKDYDKALKAWKAGE